MIPAIFNATARMVTLEDDCTINAEKSQSVNLSSLIQQKNKNSLAQVDVFKICPVSLMRLSPNKSKPNARNKAAICLALISLVKLSRCINPTIPSEKKLAVFISIDTKKTNNAVPDPDQATIAKARLIVKAPEFKSPKHKKVAALVL